MRSSSSASRRIGKGTTRHRRSRPAQATSRTPRTVAVASAIRRTTRPRQERNRAGAVRARPSSRGAPRDRLALARSYAAGISAAAVAPERSDLDALVLEGGAARPTRVRLSGSSSGTVTPSPRRGHCARWTACCVKLVARGRRRREWHGRGDRAARFTACRAEIPLGGDDNDTRSVSCRTACETLPSTRAPGRRPREPRRSRRRRARRLPRRSPRPAALRAATSRDRRRACARRWSDCRSWRAVL